ncbi:hypothetical protein [Sinorhizobium sp. CCBAU 05631]|uniref:hypothetical protein n=1 Tax=Sinorhizobium sp. CCBAU 05631 TaxID=794846 RepID=UPI0004B23E26|nr:hypothetical protein [Sinorhizobium sp. CCBAU 05631]
MTAAKEGILLTGELKFKDRGALTASLGTREGSSSMIKGITSSALAFQSACITVIAKIA